MRSNFLIKIRTGFLDVECLSHLCFHQVYLLLIKKSPNLGPNLSNLLIKTGTGFGDVECPSHLYFHQVYLLLIKNHQILVQIIESNIITSDMLQVTVILVRTMEQSQGRISGLILYTRYFPTYVKKSVSA